MMGSQLRYRGIIQKNTTGQDASGGPTDVWTQFEERSMAYEPLSGRESFLAQQLEAAVNARVRMRYLAGVRPKMRILLACRKWTTLNAILLVGGTSLTVVSAAGFPLEGNYYIRIENELLEVTAGQGTATWSVTRAKDGTTAAEHASGVSVALMIVLEIEGVIDAQGRRRELELLTMERHA